jgi:hypothetical protein
MLRVTRQYAEAIGPGSGSARVTRQYIEVLGEATIQEASVSSPLGFTSAAVIANVVLNQWINDPLGLEQVTDERGPVYVAVRHTLGLDDVEQARPSVINVAVADVLQFADRAGRTISVSLGSTLTITDEGRRAAVAESVLALVASVSAGKGGEASDLLALTDTVDLEAVVFQNVIDTLELTHAGAYQLHGPAGLAKQYRPMVGFSTASGVSAPPIAVPTLCDGTLMLTFPYESPTLTVVLRNPEFANKDALTFNRVNRATRGGTLVIYADTAWPKTQKLTVEVTCLGESQVADLRNFFVQSLGREVGLLDHEGRQWRGLILDPDTPVANPEIKDYTVTFEFEGELC